MDLNALKDFQLIAEQGGMGKASRASGKPKATLSRRLAELEETLGIRLLERGGRSLALTEAGTLLLNRISGPLREIDEAVMASLDGVATPAGRLRLAAPLLFSQVALGHLAAAFQARYPQVLIEAVADDRFSDLVAEHFDVAIRINPHKESMLVGRCFARDRQILVASPRFKKPENLCDKPLRLPAVVMTTWQEGDIWRIESGRLTVEPQPVLRLSSILTVRDAATAGAGVAMLPESIIKNQLQKGELVSWGAADSVAELWVLHTSRRLQSPKVRAFVEFVCGYYASGTFTLPG